MISTKKIAVAVALSAFVGVVPAFGHAHLSKSIPAAGATVSAPNELVLAFTEPLEPAFSTVEISDSTGKIVKTGKLEVKDNIMRLPLKSLAAGQYTVNWRALSVDTHKTSGKFTFTVKP